MKVYPLHNIEIVMNLDIVLGIMHTVIFASDVFPWLFLVFMLFSINRMVIKSTLLITLYNVKASMVNPTILSQHISILRYLFGDIWILYFLHIAQHTST